MDVFAFHFVQVGSSQNYLLPTHQVGIEAENVRERLSVAIKEPLVLVKPRWCMCV